MKKTILFMAILIATISVKAQLVGALQENFIPLICGDFKYVLESEDEIILTPKSKDIGIDTVYCRFKQGVCVYQYTKYKSDNIAKTLFEMIYANHLRIKGWSYVKEYKLEYYTTINENKIYYKLK